MVLLLGTFLATAGTAQQAPINSYKTGQKDIQALSIFEGPLSVDEAAQQKFSTIADQRFVREPAQLELWFRFELRNESETSQLLLKNLDIVHMESRFYQWKDGKIREMTANDSWGSKVVPLDLAPGESIEIIGMQRSHIYTTICAFQCTRWIPWMRSYHLIFPSPCFSSLAFAYSFSIISTSIY